MPADSFSPCEIDKITDLHLVNSMNDRGSLDCTLIAAHIQQLSGLKLVRRTRNSFDSAKKDKADDYR